MSRLHLLRLNSKLKSFGAFFIGLFFFSNIAYSATETIATGSYIINMGITPQTANNGLKPYGMIYDLIRNYNVPIKWVINQSKIKDGIDFSHNGVDYKGGPFIIPAAFRTAAVNTRITYWQGQGVVGATTVSPISVDVYITLKAAPIWTLDDQNGSIAEGYLKNALIPTTAYNWLAPAALTCCNDVFVMPHADPMWPTHGNLYTWNLDCDGAIWLACHAGSALEDLFNPSNKPQQMNFLSNKTGNAVGSGPYEENALVLWGNHADGSPPYNYAYPTDPIMQFMGILDAATQNGAEQIYLPKVSWRPGAKVYVWDPSHADVPLKSPGPAAVMVSGRGFDDPLRGRVMMEAAHSHAKASAPAYIAAQRAFFNFSYLVMSEKAVIPSLGLVPDTMYSGVGYNFGFTLPPGINPADYTIMWSASCGGAFSPNNTQNTTYTPPSVAFPTSCIITVTISDACGRVFNDAKSVVLGCNLQVSTSTSSPLCIGSANGSINLSITNGPAPFSWNWSRVSPAGTGSGTGTAITGLLAGTYNLTVTATGGCTKTLSVAISQPTAITINKTISNVSCNGGTNGTISLNPTGGTSPYTYNWGGGVTTQIRNNIGAGTYTVTVTDANGCTATNSSTVTQPTMMTITSFITPVSCFGASTGAIEVSVTGGTGSKTYLWSNGSTASIASGLAAGTYTVTVTDANGCTKTSSSTVTQPDASLNITANTQNVSCNGGTNGSIDVTVTGGTPPITYSWSTGATTQDISGLTAGTYTLTVTGSGSSTCNCPAPNAACTPPTTWNFDVVANGNVTWASLGLPNPSSITQKIRISGNGKVTVPAGTVGLTGASAVLFIDGPEFVVNSGNLQLSASGSKFLMDNGILRCLSDVQQTSNTVLCISNSEIEIGDELSNGTFNTTGNPSSSANWQNDGGYRYLFNNCGNVTQNFELSSSGTGTGTNGVDVVCKNFLEIGDEGPVNAFPTDFGVSDGDDFGIWQNSNRQYLYDTKIIIANGNFSSANNKITACDLSVKVNKTGHFQINSGTFEGTGLCVGVEDIFSNSGTWTLTGISWFSDKQNSTNVPGAGAEQTEANILNNCFAYGCNQGTVCPVVFTQAVTQPVVLSLSVNITHATCPDDPDGAINLTVNGGTAPYTYDWNNDGLENPDNDPEDLTGLLPGTYTVIVTDAEGCTATISGTVTNLNAFPQMPTQINH